MMTSMEYYKSIISDDEVIKALIRESKAREGTLFKQKTRVRPNLNFFQRTVSNLVSSNRRIKSRSEEFVSKSTEEIRR
ncbi:hypothetical protein NQ317_018235 [Molorchus minor]|uniref:Uncharacterized protein n=1 Tax=Molorchus minor TaxID=1323400 RepID=A0ABQ9K3P8_9CUCU|nr:hypothetical protein NQ317_018235 [Molorchus minor]